MLNPLDCYYLIHTYPDRFLHEELTRWLMSLGVNQNQWRTWPARDRNNHCNYNAAIHWLLHGQDRHDEFVICDCDIQPHQSHMQDFWSSQADIVGVRYPTECDNAFDKPDMIHSALWRTTRQALEAIHEKFGTWFEWQFNAGQTQTTACLCRSLVEKARAVGLTIGQGGHAMHIPRKGIAGAGSLTRYG